MNTSSNTYTVVYASVMVVIVAFLLAFTSTVLKPKSDKNEEIDKKKQILASLNIRDIQNENIEAKYAEVVLSDMIIDTLGNVKAEKGGFDVKKKDINPENLPVYMCKVDGVDKIVVPVVGKGLWGGIWGYVAVDTDKMGTVYGAYFSHESETAGLGAIIAEYEGFQKQFAGKTIYNESGDAIALSVLKAGKKVDGVGVNNRCDAITGATLTSNGVNDMLHDSLKRYMKFLKNNAK